MEVNRPTIKRIFTTATIANITAIAAPMSGSVLATTTPGSFAHTAAAIVMLVCFVVINQLAVKATYNGN